MMIVVGTVYFGCTLTNLENQWKCNGGKKKNTHRKSGRSKKMEKVGNYCIRTFKGLLFKRPSWTLSHLGHYLKLH